MNNEEIKEKLTIIFRKIFDQSDLIIHEDMTANDVENWDSLSHIEMLTAVAEEFGLKKFSLGEIRKLKNVGDFLILLDKKLNS